MPHVFMSYVREDSATVDRIATELERKNITVWLDRSDIAPGQRWQAAIRSAIQNGDFFLACFSPAYLSRSRTYMNEELTLAVEELRQRPTDRAWFIPIILSECHVPDRQIGPGETLRSIQHVSLHTDWKRGMQSLVSVLHTIIPKTQYERGLQRIAEARVQELLGKLYEDEPNDNPYQPQLHKVAEQIGALGEPAVPFLIARLQPGNIDNRILLCLRNAGTAAYAAAPELLRIWNTLPQPNRESAHDSIIFTLGELRNPVAVPFLLDELRRPSSIHKERTIAALGKIADPSVTPDLVGELMEWRPRHALRMVIDKPFPFEAAQALIEIGKPAVAELQRRLTSTMEPEANVKVRAACVLLLLDGAHRSKWSRILRLAIDEGAGMAAVEALCALRLLAPPTSSLLTATINASRASDAHVRFLATSYLYGYCKKTARVVAALSEREADQESAVASAACGRIRG